MANRFVPFHLPAIEDEEISAVVETLRSGWLTTGQKVRQFEEHFAAQVGAEYAVATNSCTAALHVALEALGVQEGDEIIVPTMTFAATAEVVAYFKATPVLVDCDPITLNLDVAALSAKITRRTKAVIPVHFAGQPCDMQGILEAAASHGLAVVEDAAHAFPSSYRGKPVGALGDITCFSFYATKTLTTGEGGMATTNNQARAERMRRMTLHGITRDAWMRYSDAGSWYYEIGAPGYKYNLTDIAAAIGIEQLAKAGRFLEARRKIAAAYNSEFADLPELRLPLESPGSGHSWHLYVIQLDLHSLRISRNGFIEALKKSGVGASVHFIPLHLHPYYRSRFGFTPADFPVASETFERIVSLPIYPRMTDADIRHVIESVRTIVAEYRR
ncbi:MAG TPA: DegT/DnrJ/EryC1/StrS family aminotransferase [Nitrospira sp.]|nr:DegT/DnrJ/EryC1/StrS family aminotransferase [Nitrospira sp.]